MTTTTKKYPELLLPAGSPSALRTALLFGADAVYLGGEAFSLRAKAKNFSGPELEAGIRFAHEHRSPTHPGGAKVYVTANVMPHNKDLAEAEGYFRELAALKPDGILVSDPGMFTLAKNLCPEVPLHISTQANCINKMDFAFWHGLGASRVVAARELSLAELKEIRTALPPDLEIEAFVHGAMCISYSGRCLLSAFFNNRSANLGECTHPCRWPYHLEFSEESRPGQIFFAEENERGTFLFHSRDLCMIEHIPELMEAGVMSFKVEGRMKNDLYVASIARAYRQAIDEYLSDPAAYHEHKSRYLEDVKKTSARPYCTGFYFGPPTEEGQIYDTKPPEKNAVYLGTVESAEALPGGGLRLSFHQKNKFSAGETIQLVTPSEDISCPVREMYDEHLNPIDSCPHPEQLVYINVQEAPGHSPAGIPVGSLLRKTYEQ